MKVGFTYLSVIFLSYITFYTGVAQEKLDYEGSFSQPYSVSLFPEEFGGKKEFKRFVQDHQFYPIQSRSKKTEGVVILHFNVEQKGRGSNPTIFKSLDSQLDKEALRLLKLIEWVPDIQNKKLIHIERAIEFAFSISKYKKYVKVRGFDSSLYAGPLADTSLGVYEKCDKRPAFADTALTLYEFVAKYLVYPEMARASSIEGSVEISFIIELDGRVTNINVIKGLESACNQEAIRIIGETRWVPAIQNGKYVRFRQNISVTFNLQTTIKDNSSSSQRPWGQ